MGATQMPTLRNREHRDVRGPQPKGETMERTREEHLQWCKDRALEYCDANDPDQAFASFLSDVTKHPETMDIRDTIGMLGLPLKMMGQLETAEKMRNHIEGYN